MFTVSAPTVGAIDLGFGNTKFACSRDADNAIVCQLFPSRVALANKKLCGGLSKQRDTVLVEVDGTQYEVGPDVDLALPVHNSQVLHEKFIETPHYMALFKGALSYMQGDDLEMLVVGLPVQFLTSKSRILATRLQGEHIVAKQRKVRVRRVKVLAQPLGGFTHHVVTQGMNAGMQQQSNLIIDAGNFTLDWLLTHGFKPNDHQSGTFPAGMSAIVRRVAEAIGQDMGIHYDNHAKIDRCLHSGGFRLNGRSMDLDTYLRHAQPVIEEGINAMVNQVGDLRDVDNIALVGGGARYYEHALRAKYPHMHFLSMVDPVFANVKGFYNVAEQSRRQVEAA